MIPAHLEPNRGAAQHPAGFTGRGPPERRALVILAVLSCGGLAAIGLVAADTPQTQARVAFGALPAIACLVSFGFELMRARLLLRAALPLVGLIGTVVALRGDVVGIYS